ncbi:hypothetical protein MTR67_002337 [Solanum verrucosum]|uniref:Uncharacterized protein n=1 Tax=Solanum verrucosum TaxID=315347 RepID=A0AAF0PQC7_SOLVR|nr:hypothetical protein MTR67_002337 [Solanum verrucosum]
MFSEVKVVELLVAVPQLSRVGVEGYDNRVDLIILGIVDFDVILGIYWLSPYHASLNCNSKIVTLVLLDVLRVEWTGACGSYPSKVISFIHAHILVERGCLSYLTFNRDTSIELPLQDSIPVVQEFLNVFLSNVPGDLPDRDIDFAIYLKSGTKPIYVPPCHMAPLELKE